MRHEKRIDQTQPNNCQTLLAQIKQAFAANVSLPGSSEFQHVSSVFVFNSGEISSDFRSRFRSEIAQENSGQNVQFFDGSQLIQLESNANFHQGVQFIPRLTGMSTDLQMSVAVYEAILSELPEFLEMRGSFTTALMNFMAAPFLEDMIDANDVGEFIQHSRIIDCICQRHLNFVAMPDATKANDLSVLQSVIKRAIRTSEKLLPQIHAALQKFQLSPSEG